MGHGQEPRGSLRPQAVLHLDSGLFVEHLLYARCCCEGRLGGPLYGRGHQYGEAGCAGPGGTEDVCLGLYCGTRSVDKVLPGKLAGNLQEQGRQSWDWPSAAWGAYALPRDAICPATRWLPLVSHASQAPCWAPPPGQPQPCAHFSSESHLSGPPRLVGRCHPQTRPRRLGRGRVRVP